MNLQHSRNITAIATQGVSGSFVNHYYVSYSDGGNKWNNHMEQWKLKNDFFSRPRERWHMDRKMTILMFQLEMPYSELRNVVTLFRRLASLS